jgi:hypothetical protein
LFYNPASRPGGPVHKPANITIYTITYFEFSFDTHNKVVGNTTALAVNEWLQGFVYRIEINAWVFVLAGVKQEAVACGFTKV